MLTHNTRANQPPASEARKEVMILSSIAICTQWPLTFTHISTKLSGIRVDKSTLLL